MTKRPFGKTGLHVSPLGFGSAPVGLLATDRARAAEMLNLLLDHGVNLIDTAANYAGAEEVIGQTIGHRRGEFVLVSKCGSKVPDVDGEPWSAGLVARTVDRALRRLRTDVIDVMLLHSCDQATLERGEALGALVEARRAGKIRFAGYSGDNDTAAHAATLPDVAVIQTSVNFVDQVNLDKVLPACRANGLGVMAKRPIANAAWKDLDQQPGFYKDYARTYTDRVRALNLRPTDVGLAPDAWSELALRFTLSQPGVHTAIIGTTNPDNARHNIDLVAKGPLPPAAVEKIRAAFKAADPNGEWWGQT